MGGGKRRALKKLLNKQQSSESPSPYPPISSEPLDIDASLAGDDASSAPPSPEHAKAQTIPAPPASVPVPNTNGAAVAGGGEPSPVPSQASAPAALGGGGMYGAGGGGMYGGQQQRSGGKKSSKQRFAERQVSVVEILLSARLGPGRQSRGLALASSIGMANACARAIRGPKDGRRQHVWARSILNAHSW